MIKNIGIIAFIAVLSGCTYLQGTQSENHKAMCGQLKNKIVMNGATANPRNAQIQRDDMRTLNKTYENEGC